MSYDLIRDFYLDSGSFKNFLLSWDGRFEQDQEPSNFGKEIINFHILLDRVCCLIKYWTLRTFKIIDLCIQSISFHLYVKWVDKYFKCIFKQINCLFKSQTKIIMSSIRGKYVFE